jgi:sterol desaturase/sphingolipid hydroxylase (fatty acid hydroxylase superfamily)
MDIHFLLSLALTPFLRPLNFGDPFSLWSLAGAVLTATVFFLLRRRHRTANGARAIRARHRALGAFLIPRRILNHASMKLDLKFYLVTSALFGLLFALWPITAAGWSAMTVHGLARLLAPASHALGGWPAMALATLAYAVVFDLSYYCVHRLLHDVPALWEFHKVHHSAEVMTPMTEWRQHPVETLAFPISAGFFTGVLQGLMVWGFGPDAKPVAIGGVNLVMLFYVGSILHLRHTHVWMPFRGVWGRIFQSPAHHQIHHSMRPEHFGKNLGFALSIFDWAFGTLSIPPGRAPGLKFGLTPAEDHGKTLVAAMVEPVGKAWGHVVARPRSAPPLEPPNPAKRSSPG